MVVHPAVIGLAGHRGVGDGDLGHRQAGSSSVRGHQHRTQRGLALQPASFVQTQQDLGSAVDAGELVGRGEVGRTGVGGRAHPVDLNRGISGSQAAVVDETRQRIRTHRRAELRQLC